MPLKISLRPHEKLILGGAVVTNGAGRADLVVENRVPILREKDILVAEAATSPCRRIYFIVQLMYVDEGNLARHQRAYWSLVRELIQAAPSALCLVAEMSDEILAGRHFRALKVAKKLIAYEEELLAHVRQPTGSVSHRAEEPDLGSRARGRRPDQGRAEAENLPG